MRKAMGIMVTSHHLILSLSAAGQYTTCPSSNFPCYNCSHSFILEEKESQTSKTYTDQISSSSPKE